MSSGDIRIRDDARDLHEQLEAVLGAPLLPEGVDSYAEMALTGLIAVSTQAADRYVLATGSLPAANKELEDEAFHFFGLGDIEATLGHLVVQIEKICLLDDLIAHTSTTDEIITPTVTESANPVIPSSGGFERKSHIPRLKTLLYVLSSRFDLDVGNENDVRILKGSVSPSSIRRSPYYSVEVPSLDRVILVCDEENNATFVFATSSLEQQDTSVEKLRKLVKPELVELIMTTSNIGRQINYSENFVSEVIASLQSIDGTGLENGELSSSSLLYPNAPDDVLSINGFAKTLDGITRAIALKAAEELGDELGPVHTYSFKNMAGPGYTLEQQQMIKQHLEHTGWLGNSAPEGVVNVSQMTASLNTSSTAIYKAIATLGDQLGEVTEFVFNSGKKTYGYDQRQQAMIKAKLESEGKLVESAPDGYKSRGGIATELAVNDRTVNIAIEELGEELGPTKQYKFHTVRTDGYDQRQQAMIKAKLEEQGRLAESAGPNKIESVNTFCRALGVSRRALAEILEDESISAQLGELKTYRFGVSRLAVGFDERQQGILMEALDEKDLLAALAPEGVVAASVIAKEMQVEQGAVYKAVEALGEGLGKIEKYKFRTAITDGYSLVQQAAIKAHIKANGYTEPAPDGVLSEKKFADTLGISPTVIRRATQELEDQLGEVKRYSFGTRATNGYDKTQQERIVAHLKEEDMFAEVAPNGALTFGNLFKKLHVAPQTLKQAIAELGGDLGELTVYRFGPQRAIGYRPEQQALLARHLSKQDETK